MEDYEVIEACLQGKKEMFELLVSRYKNLVYSIILRMTNDAEEANDLAQEVFIKVYRNLDKYQPDYKFSTWIMRITTNLVIDARRKNKHTTVSV
ncbi:MAG TPA: sigma-70 family RNA polymerase sigma factor, partial [Defluviitaleaceae bacterium]|nr:sigma-70 family RNA polymerase sigma factor [Defluviitaleaceae bacterium]